MQQEEQEQLGRVDTYAAVRAKKSLQQELGGEMVSATMASCVGVGRGPPAGYTGAGASRGRHTEQALTSLK